MDEDRPIVERPDEPPWEAMGEYDLKVWAYIEYLEKERERLETAIREKDRRLEGLADEVDAWERTVRDI